MFGNYCLLGDQEFRNKVSKFYLDDDVKIINTSAYPIESVILLLKYSYDCSYSIYLDDDDNILGKILNTPEMRYITSCSYIKNEVYNWN